MAGVGRGVEAVLRHIATAEPANPFAPAPPPPPPQAADMPRREVGRGDMAGVGIGARLGGNGKGKEAAFFPQICFFLITTPPLFFYLAPRQAFLPTPCLSRPPPPCKDLCWEQRGLTAAGGGHRDGVPAHRAAEPPPDPGRCAGGH